MRDDFTSDDIRSIFDRVGLSVHVDVVDVDGGMSLQAKPGRAICDFCSAVPIVHTFNVESIEVLGGRGLPGGRRHVSEGAWAACSTCRDIIRTGDRSKLVDHSFAQFIKKYGRVSNTKIARLDIKCIQDAFWAVYEG